MSVCKEQGRDPGLDASDAWILRQHCKKTRNDSVHKVHHQKCKLKLYNTQKKPYMKHRHWDLLACCQRSVSDDLRCISVRGVGSPGMAPSMLNEISRYMLPFTQCAAQGWSSYFSRMLSTAWLCSRRVHMLSWFACSLTDRKHMSQ